MLKFGVRTGSLVLLALVLVPMAPALAGAGEGKPLVVDVSNQTLVTRLAIGPFTDTNGQGRDFTTPGLVFLDDDREILVSGTRKWKASKSKGTYSLRSESGFRPKTRIEMKTKGSPEAVVRLEIKIKESDGSKTKILLEGDDLDDVQLILSSRALSDTWTTDGVKWLLRGDEDFELAIARFDAALAADGSNPNPLAFRALARFFLFLRQELVDSDGDLRALYRDAGYQTGPSPTLWHLDLEEESHGEGAVKDSAPRGNKVQKVFRKSLVPALEQLRDDLASVPASFEYRLSIDSSGEFFDGNPADDVESVWFDYGDVQLLRSIAQVQLAWLLFFDAYDLDKVEPDDFDEEDHPSRDMLDLLESRYERLGRLRQVNSLTSAKEHVEGAFVSYKAGVTAILAETSAQQDNGLFTPYRTTLRGGSWLGDTEGGDTFFDTEGDFRTWFQGLVDRFDVNADTTITTGPDGTTIPVEDRATVNFVEFWRGIDIRRLYVKTIENPIKGETIIGVTSVDDLTSDMFTASGAIVRLNGVAPKAGDIADGYGLRIKKPKKHTKTVDGNLGDWNSSNRTTILKSPRATLSSPRPDFGKGWVAIDGSNLYLGFSVATANVEWVWIRIWSPSGEAGFSSEGGAFGDVASPTVGDTGPNFELGVPLSNFGSEKWVEIEIEVVMNPGEQSARSGRIFVKIR